MHFAFFDAFLPFLYHFKLISSILKILTRISLMRCIKSG